VKGLLASNWKALGFLIAYVLFVFIFAGLYSLLCPDGFFAPYAHYERSWKDDTRRVESTLAEAFNTWSSARGAEARNTALSCISEAEKITSCTNDLGEMPVIGADDFEVTNLKVVEGSTFSFDLYYRRQLPLPSDPSMLPPNMSPGDVVMEDALVSITAILEADRDTPRRFSLRLQDYLPYEYLPIRATVDNTLLHKWGNQERYLPLSKTQKAEVRNYLDEYIGISYNIGSSYFRMLYMSAVIITTLGLGDIVPLSGLARALVGTEAMLGIILIGAFINSVTSKPRVAQDVCKLTADATGYKSATVASSPPAPPLPAPPPPPPGTAAPPPPPPPQSK